MNYQAVIFDFDYTLGDSTDAIVICMNYALNKFGHESKSVEAIRKTIGMSLAEAYMVLEESAKAEDGKAFHDYFVEKSASVMAQRTTFFDGALDLLYDLRKKGYRIGIVTTKNRVRMDEIFAKFDVAELFDVVIGGSDVVNQKPAPDALLLAIKELNLNPKEVLYVGDSVIDAKTANRANVDFVGVTTGTTAKEQLEEHGPIAVLNHVKELPSIGL